MILIFTLQNKKYILPVSCVISLFITFFSNNGLLAQSSVNQISSPVSINHKKVSASSLFKELDKQTGYNFFYDPQQVADVQLSKINYSQAQLGKVLADLETNTGLKFSLINKNISVKVTPASSAAKVQEPGKVLGKIVDDKGETLPGASIRVTELKTGVSSSVDGTYSINLAAGTYTLEVSYISFQTKRITGVEIRLGQITRLDVVLKPSTNTLEEVVVTSTYRKESVDGLYAQQKNSASISDGISAEQIARTPDNNIGQVLKRVSGITTIDNRYVVVRGLSERYNQAMIDGIVIPSTDMNRRNFSFDIIPAELVSNVVVNKTATPDVSSEFSGGQVSINTLDIPDENFTFLEIGTGYNSNTTGKNFLQAGGRGKYDYLGFDDGRRRQPEGIRTWNRQDGFPDFAIPQSRLFSNQSLRLYEYNGNLNQNYRVSLGRLVNLKSHLKLGIIAGASLRNTQETNPFETIRGGASLPNEDGANPIDDPAYQGSGFVYKFNTTSGAIANIALQGDKFKLVSKNLFSRVFTDNLYDGYRTDPLGNPATQPDLRIRRIFADPEITSVFQNKVDGEHSLGDKGIKLNWNAAVTNIRQGQQDRRKLSYRQLKIDQDIYYPFANINNFGQTGLDLNYRLYTRLFERDYNWLLSTRVPFNFLKDKSEAKAGYTGWYKKRSLGSLQLGTFGSADTQAPYDIVLAPGNISANAYYFANEDNGQQYAGNSKYHAAYLMFDQRFFQKLRIVYGVRSENFNLQNRQEEFIRNPDTLNTNVDQDPEITGEKNWSFLPSTNLTYSLTPKMNIRVAYATTIVRPDFRETAYFGLYDPYLEAGISGWNVVSTRIYNTDLRYEFYPAPGEIISVSAFYKRFDKPLELVFQQEGYYRFQNQRSAVNRGLEIEFRKSPGFLSGKQWLKNLVLYGNATIMRSQVDAINYFYDEGFLIRENVPGIKRPLYGQSPFIVNGGISYITPTYGINLVYNRSGYRTYTISNDPNQTEFENGRDAIDLQLSTRVLKKKAEIKLNISNLLNTETVYYQNINEYTTDPNQPLERINGTDAYETDKDRAMYRINFGRTALLSFGYRF